MHQKGSVDQFCNLSQTSLTESKEKSTIVFDAMNKIQILRGEKKKMTTARAKQTFYELSCSSSMHF